MKRTSRVFLMGLLACLAFAPTSWAQVRRWGYTGVAQTAGRWRFYNWTIPSGTSMIRVETSAGWGDADVYLRYNYRPTTGTYWRRSALNGNADAVVVYNPPAGRLVIGVYARRGFGGVWLRGMRVQGAYAPYWRSDMLDRMNFERARYGRVRLGWSSQLGNAAQVHASDMARRNFLSHTGSDGSTVRTRISRQGYFTGYRSYGWAENVARGQRSVAQVMTSWMNSTTHRGNILNSNFRHFGCGYAYNGNTAYKGFWCQTFGYRNP